MIYVIKETTENMYFARVPRKGEPAKFSKDIDQAIFCYSEREANIFINEYRLQNCKIVKATILKVEEER